MGQLEPAGIDSLLFLFVSDPYFRIETSRFGLSTAAGLRCELAKGFSPLSCQVVRPASDTVLVYSSFRSQQVVAASRLAAQFLQPVSRGVLLRIRGETTSMLFSRQRSKLIPASPADLLAEDWFSFIGFPFC